MPSQLQVLLLPANFELDRMKSHEHSLAAKTVAKWWPLKSLLNFKIKFLRIAGTSEAEPLISGKAEYSLAISEDKKSKLFGVTFSFKLKTCELNATKCILKLSQFSMIYYKI